MLARIAVLHENPAWLQPLFAELKRAGIVFEEWRADSLTIDPRRTAFPDLVFNRMSASAQWRGHAHARFAALELLRMLEARGVDVINGARAFELETSKLAQLDAFRRAGVHAPATLAVNHPDEIAKAARRLGFPLIVKPNCGGAGHGVLRIANEQELAGAHFDFGCDHIILLQQDVSTETLLRIEVLDGQVLYAVRVERAPGQVMLCPADACAAQARFIPTQIPYALEQAVLAVARAARFDLGSVECFLSPRTGDPVFFDINVLSNFVPDLAPWSRVIEFLRRRLNSVPR